MTVPASTSSSATRARRTQSIRDDGRNKVLAGVTTLEEVLRVTREDSDCPWALSNTRLSTPAARNARASSKAIRPRHVRQLLREKQLLPVDVTRSVAEAEAARAAQLQCSAAACLGSRSRAGHAPAGHPGELRPAARRSAARGLAADRKAARAEHPPRRALAKVMEGHTLADGLGDFPPGVPGNLPCHGCGRRAVRPPRCGARAARRLHREPEVLRQKVLGAMLYPIVLSVMCALIVSGTARLRRTQGGGRVFEDRPGSARSLTVMLIGFSDFLRDYGIFLLVALVLAGLASCVLLAPGGPAALRQAAVALPLLAKLVRGSTPRASPVRSAS
jgi:general secretion pathway protein F